MAFPKEGPDQYLSPEEEKFLHRMLGFPESIPKPFWGAMIQKMALDGEPIPRSQILGLAQFVANTDAVATSESPGGTSFDDLATVGPQVTGLSNGSYLTLFGCQTVCVANAFSCAVSLAKNDETAVDADGFSHGWTVSEGTAVESFSTPGMRALVVTLDEDNNNTLTMKYRKVSGTAPNFSNRWLIALKIGN